MHKNKSPKLGLLLAGCLILIIYGTLYPLSGWRAPSAGVITLLLKQHSYSLSDIATNYIIYVPLGALLAAVLPGRTRLGHIITAVILLSLLSLLLETTQTMLPARVPSIIDTMLNTAGAATGALLSSSLLQLVAVNGRFQQIRRAHWRDDAATRTATVALLLWLAAQWSPFVPYIDPHAIWGALEPLRDALHGTELSLQRIIKHTLELAALGILINTALRDPYTSAAWLAVLLGLGLAGNMLIVTQQVYPERVIGTAAAVILTGLLQGPMSRPRAATGILLLGLGVLAGELWPPFSSSGTAFNWIPLKEQLPYPLVGIQDLLDGIWPFCAMAAFTAGAMPRHRPDWLTFTLGGALVAGYAGGLEWAQQWQPLHYPDITDVLMAGIGWTIGHVAAASVRTESPLIQTSKSHQASSRHRRTGKNGLPACNATEHDMSQPDQCGRCFPAQEGLVSGSPRIESGLYQGRRQQ